MADKIIDINDDSEENAITERGLTATGITAISIASSAVVTVANDLVNGDIVRFSGCLGMVQINGLTGVVSARSDTGFTVDIATNGATETAVVVATTVAATPTTVVSTAHGLAVGDSVFFEDMNEHTELNGIQAVVTVVTDADNYTVNFAGAGDTNESTGGLGTRIAALFTAYSGTAGLVTVVSAVTRTVRIAVDNSKTRSQIADSIQRGKEYFIKNNVGV